MCRHQTWHKRTSRTRRFFALTHSMNMHGRAAAMVTPIGDKKTLLPAESAVSSSGCAGRGRVKRAARERRNGSTQGCRERSDAKVCASASVAEGMSATLPVSRGYVLAISALMGMGGPPKHIYTLTSGTYPRGHPPLSLDPCVTAVTAISPPLRISGQLLGASLRACRRAEPSACRIHTHCENYLS